MNRTTVAGALVALVGFGFMASGAVSASGASEAIAAAVSDSARPATDTARDNDRKPSEMLSFAGVKAGDRVADYAAGSGYFTRLFAGVVGPTGHAYAVVPSALFVYPSVERSIPR